MKPTVAVLAAVALTACSTPERPVAADVVPPQPKSWAHGGNTEPIDHNWWQSLGAPELTRAIHNTLRQNFDLKAAQARLAAAAAQARLAGSALYPTLDLGGGATRQRSVFVGLPFGGTGPFSNTFNNFGVNLNASWEIDIWNRLGAAEDASLADMQASAADLRALHQSLAGQTAKAFYATVEARQQIALATETLASYRVSESQVESRFRRGVRSALDFRLARTQRVGAETQKHIWEEVFARTVRQLQFLQGRYPDGKEALPATLPDPADAIAVGLPADVIRFRPDVTAAARRLAAAGFRVDEAQASLYPQLSLSGSIGTTSDRTNDLLDIDFLVWTLAANLVAPILDGGARRAQRDATIYREHEAVANFAQSILTAYTEVESLLAAEVFVRRQLETLALANAESQAARNLSEDRYRRGLGDFITVLAAQRSALNLEAQRITTQRQLLDLRVDLHLALGGGFLPHNATSDADDSEADSR